MRSLVSICALIGAYLLAPGLATPIENQARAVTFGQRTIFTPPSNYRKPKVLYARSAILPDGSLLATWENYSPEPPKVFFPIYKSTDKGASWKSFSTVQDTKNGWGLRYQPFLYVLPDSWAGYPAGTVLLAGNSIPSDLSATHIDLYASQDHGSTWTFVSNVAVGGAANTNNGQTPVWEPFVLLYKGALVVYYSDQRDKSYAQKLVYQSSTNGKTWGPVVNIVATSPYTNRPGMATVAALPNGKWIMTYEYGSGSPFHYPIYYKISNDPTVWPAGAGTALHASASSSPYVVWSAVGGSSGTIAISAGSSASIFTSTDLGATWKTIGTTAPAAYARELKLLDSSGTMMILGGGHLGGDNVVGNAEVSL